MSELQGFKQAAVTTHCAENWLEASKNLQASDFELGVLDVRQIVATVLLNDISLAMLLMLYSHLICIQ